MTIAMPASSAAAMTSASFIDPPGWMAAVLVLRPGLNSDQEFRRAQAEFCIFATTFGPSSRPLAHQARAHANQWLNPQLFGDRNNLPKLLQLLDYHDHLLAELRSQ